MIRTIFGKSSNGRREHETFVKNVPQLILPTNFDDLDVCHFADVR